MLNLPHITTNHTGGNNACTQTPGYYHRTDQSAMNCCQLLRGLQITDDANKFDNELKPNAMQLNRSPNLTTRNELSQMAAGEIQCNDISQSQMSPVIQPQTVQKSPQVQQLATRPQPQPQPHPQQTTQSSTQQQQQQQPQQVTNVFASIMPMQVANNTIQNSAMSAVNVNVQNQQISMRHDIYQRTLEYVQNCQSWTEQPEMVTSTSNINMQISDMSTSLSSLLEENRYYNSVL